MKKAICLLLTALFAVSVMSVTAAAEEPSNSVEIMVVEYDDYGANANTQYQTNSEGLALAIPLKPVNTDTPDDCWFDFSIELPGDCTSVEFVFSYAAKGEGRYMDVTFKDELQHVLCPDTLDWAIYNDLTVTFPATEKGTYTLRLAAPADFDNETIKTPNVELITVNMYYESYETVPEKQTEPDVTEPQETEPKEDDVPQTTSEPDDVDLTVTNPVTDPQDDSESKGCGSDFGGVAVILSLTAALGAALISKKR